MNHRQAKKLVEERIKYEKINGIDKLPNEILENYSKQDIKRSIAHCLWNRKKLKDVNIKEYMIQWLEKNKDKKWQNKLE